MKHRKLKLKTGFLVIAGCAVLLPLIVLMFIRLEGEKPRVTFETPAATIGKQKELRLRITDGRTGLKDVWIAFSQNQKETVLFEQSYPFSGLFSGGSVKDREVKTGIIPEKMGFSNGPGLLRIRVRDYSWRSFLSGNTTYLEKKVEVDTRPPGIDVLTPACNVAVGGSALVIYRLSEPCVTSGVQVGQRFFPGHSGYFSDPDVMLAFFALDHEANPQTPLRLKAEDRAGNRTVMGFSHHIRKKRFKADTIRITDGFLHKNALKFTNIDKSHHAKSELDAFLYVNRDLRHKNYRTIVAAAAGGENSMYWEGAFGRLPNSMRKAGFADRRTYVYKGETIDRQVHLGIDLASTAHAEVPAANRGRAAFCGPIGIYGNTVILDHGYGLFSIYSHLSHIAVEKGAVVEKGGIIGKTGQTGLALGDHLHFGMFIQDVFVNPVEWWDAKWIKNNIFGKIADVKALLGNG